MPNFRLITNVTGLTPNDIHDVLTARHRSQRRGHRARFVSIKTKQWEVGYPLTPQGGVVPRWFDKTDSPHQSFLPFYEFQPVRMPQLTNHNGYSWRLTYQNDEGCLEADLDVLYPNQSHNRILAIQVYRSVEIRNREEPDNPCQEESLNPFRRRGGLATFVELYGTPGTQLQSSPTPSRPLPRRPDVSGTLRMYFEDSYINGELRRIVAEAYGMGSLGLLTENGELVTDRGAVVGYIDACAYTPGSDNIRGFHEFTVHVRGISQPMLARVPERMRARSDPFTELTWTL